MNTFREVVRAGIRDCTLTRMQKARLRISMIIRPAVRKEVEALCWEECESQGINLPQLMTGDEEHERYVTGDMQLYGIDIDKLERLLQIIIEYLPKLLAIILPLFSESPTTFESVTASMQQAAQGIASAEAYGAAPSYGWPVGEETRVTVDKDGYLLMRVSGSVKAECKVGTAVDLYIKDGEIYAK